MSQHLQNPAIPPPYAELHCLSSFSFQRGASQPDELVERAHQLGYSALAITDECSVAGVVRADQAARHARAQQAPCQGEPDGAEAQTRHQGSLPAVDRLAVHLLSRTERMHVQATLGHRPEAHHDLGFRARDEDARRVSGEVVKRDRCHGASRRRPRRIAMRVDGIRDHRPILSPVRPALKSRA